MSMPESYWPSSLKYFLFIANRPPAMVGDLGGEALEMRFGPDAAGQSADYVVGQLVT